MGTVIHWPLSKMRLKRLLKEWKWYEQDNRRANKEYDYLMARQENRAQRL